QPNNGNRCCNSRKFYAQQLADLPRSPPDRLAVRARTLVIYFDLQLRSSCKYRHCHFAVYPAAFTMVGRGYRWRGYELGVELCCDLGPDLAVAVRSVQFVANAICHSAPRALGDAVGQHIRMLGKLAGQTRPPVYDASRFA